MIKLFSNYHSLRTVETSIIMNAIEKLKKACAFKPFISLTNLPAGNYTIQQFQRLDTFNGPRVRAVLEEYIVYLPDRFVELITHETVKELGEQTVILKNFGPDPEDGNRLKIDFEFLPSNESPSTSN